MPVVRHFCVRTRLVANILVLDKSHHSVFMVFPPLTCHTQACNVNISLYTQGLDSLPELGSGGKGWWGLTHLRKEKFKVLPWECTAKQVNGCDYSALFVGLDLATCIGITRQDSGSRRCGFCEKSPAAVTQIK